MRPQQEQADVHSAARIVLRPIGSPLTLSMSGLAIASLLESGLALSWIPWSQSADAGAIMLAVPFLLQLAACLMSYMARDGTTGAAVGVLATTWAAVGLIHLLSPDHHRGGAIGLLLLSAAGMLAISGSAAATTTPLSGAIFVLAAARFVLTGIYDLGGPSPWQHASGLVGLVLCGAAGYATLAYGLEGQRGRPVLPTLRRGAGRVAVTGDLHAQLEHVTHEAGVRQTS